MVAKLQDTIKTNDDAVQRGQDRNGGMTIDELKNLTVEIQMEEWHRRNRVDTSTTESSRNERKALAKEL
jgi:hypothetical protein